MIKRRVFSFLSDLFYLIYFSDKRYVLVNLINFAKAFLKRERVAEFYFRDLRVRKKYIELVSYVYLLLKYKKLLIGKITTDVVDYTKLGVDFEDKTILDIGAWIGDSILLFHKLGAKKIIAYEPIRENVEFAKKIIEKFNIICEIHQKAVCERTGKIRFVVDEEEYGTSGLSLFKKDVRRKRRVEIECINWESVILDAIKNKVDLVKVDCEGCEKFLVNVDNELIKRIPEWIIECHDLETTKRIYKKFTENGFKLRKLYINIFPDVNILYFKSIIPPNSINYLSKHR